LIALFKKLFSNEKWIVLNSYNTTESFTLIVYLFSPALLYECLLTIFLTEQNTAAIQVHICPIIPRNNNYSGSVGLVV